MRKPTFFVIGGVVLGMIVINLASSNNSVAMNFVAMAMTSFFILSFLAMDEELSQLMKDKNNNNFIEMKLKDEKSPEPLRETVIV